MISQGVALITEGSESLTLTLNVNVQASQDYCNTIVWYVDFTKENPMAITIF